MELIRTELTNPDSKTINSLQLTMIDTFHQYCLPGDLLWFRSKTQGVAIEGRCKETKIETKTFFSTKFILINTATKEEKVISFIVEAENGINSKFKEVVKQ